LPTNKISEGDIGGEAWRPDSNYFFIWNHKKKLISHSVQRFQKSPLAPLKKGGGGDFWLLWA
jgi:hypothetical protein